ncbi:MAG: helix-turn-helix domain-containing protein [Gemmatimonadota bacterium]
MGIAERKQREFERREREILDAALELFSDDDWQAVTVEQIAERAEIGKGTVYKHFTSKDEIYARLASEFQTSALERLEAIDPKLPVTARLRAIVRVFWERHRGAREYQRLVQYCERDDFRKCLTPDSQAELAALDARLRAAIDRVLQDGIDQGILPMKPLEALVFGPMAALQGAVRLLWSGMLAPETRPGQHLDEITNFIMAGMLYQEWLAEEGLDEAEIRRRAEAEVRAAAEDETAE